MKHLYTSSDFLIVGHLAEVLKRHHIYQFVRNLYLAGGAGELPPTDIWPELWVNDEDYELARRLIDEVLGNNGATPPAWVCSGCGERIEGQFASLLELCYPSAARGLGPVDIHPRRGAVGECQQALAWPASRTLRPPPSTDILSRHDHVGKHLPAPAPGRAAKPAGMAGECLD